MKTLKIKEAPGYSITENGDIVNDKIGATITQKDNRVRLNVDKKRKTFIVPDLVEMYPFKKAAKKTKETPKQSFGTTEVPAKTEKAVDKKIAAKEEEEDEFAKYPYKIKKRKEIEKARKGFSVGDKVTFKDYQTKRKTKGTIISHTKFSDGYPAARVKSSKGTKLVSYLNLNK